MKTDVKIIKKIKIFTLILLSLLLILTGCAEQPESKINSDDLSPAEASEREDKVEAEAEEENLNINENNKDTETNAGYENGFVFVRNGTNVYLGENVSRVLNELGSNPDCFESDSCTSDGIMITYLYGGFEISTYIKEPDLNNDDKNNKENECIFMIVFNDDSVSTSEGIYIGQAVGDMTAVYGEADEKFEGSYYRYLKNGTALSFDVDDDIIISVTYQLLVI